MTPEEHFQARFLDIQRRKRDGLPKPKITVFTEKDYENELKHVESVKSENRKKK